MFGGEEKSGGLEQLERAGGHVGASGPGGVRLLRVRPPRVISSVERRNIIISLILLVAILSTVLYYFAIPKINLEIETWYNEPTMGGILVDVTIRNNAPVSLTNFSLTISLYNESGGDVATTTYKRQSIGPWESTSFPSLDVPPGEMKYNTNFDNYTIRLDISFFYKGERQYSFEYKTEEPYMNLFYRSTIHDR